MPFIAFLTLFGKPTIVEYLFYTLFVSLALLHAKRRSVLLRRWTSDQEGNEYIVMELLPLGSLDVVLRRTRTNMRIKAKIAICAQICQGMCQLAEEKVLHRDLATRNVLVQSLDPVIVKVYAVGSCIPFSAGPHGS